MEKTGNLTTAPFAGLPPGPAKLSFRKTLPAMAGTNAPYQPQTASGDRRSVTTGNFAAGSRRCRRCRRGSGGRSTRAGSRRGITATAAAAAFGQIALLVAVLLEIGLVPATTCQPERWRTHPPLHRGCTALRTCLGIWIGQFLQAVETMTVAAFEFINGHEALRTNRHADRQSSHCRCFHQLFNIHRLPAPSPTFQYQSSSLGADTGSHSPARKSPAPFNPWDKT